MNSLFFRWRSWSYGEGNAAVVARRACGAERGEVVETKKGMTRPRNFCDLRMLAARIAKSSHPRSFSRRLDGTDH